MGTTIKKYCGVEVPDRFGHNIQLAQAYAAGVIRVRHPEADAEALGELYSVGQKFIGRAAEILDASIYYALTEGKEFVAQARAYLAGENIDQKPLKRFDPSKLEKPIRWSQLRHNISITNTLAGPDTVTHIARMHQDPSTVDLVFLLNEDVDPADLRRFEINDLGYDIGRIRSRELGRHVFDEKY
jgi:hypothetical protein